MLFYVKKNALGGINMEEKLPIYNIKVRLPGREEAVPRKAVDMEALNIWLDNNLDGRNPLLISDKDVPPTMTIGEYKGIVARQIVTELGVMVKKSLGLIPEEKEPEVETVEAPEEKPEPKPVKVEKPAPKKVESEEDEDIVVL
jgi:hypothetical protein